MNKKIEGVIPVMLTPFTSENKIDYVSLEKLIEWYISNSADALFAVCQSSEMQFLSYDEKVELGTFVVQKVNGRIPVVVSGHTSDDPYNQLREVQIGVKSGADAFVLVSNHLDPKNEGEETFIGNLNWLLDNIPEDLALGIYECPAPYRRLLSDNELKFLAESGRFYFMKDVSCDLGTVKRRVEITAGTDMVILNANAAIAWDAIKAGSKGFNGVMANVYPDLYSWLYKTGYRYPELAAELADFLVLAGCTESYGYPVLAKLYHKRIGTFETIKSRSYPHDIQEKVWGVDAIMDRLISGVEFYRNKIKDTQ